MFAEGYVRTSSEIYNLNEDCLDQVYVHLTNNAIQKYSKNYGKFEEANITSVDQLCQELATDMSPADLKQSLYAKIELQIIESLQAVR